MVKQGLTLKAHYEFVNILPNIIIMKTYSIGNENIFLRELIWFYDPDEFRNFVIPFCFSIEPENH